MMYGKDKAKGKMKSGMKNRRVAQGPTQKTFPIENKSTMHDYSYEVKKPKTKQVCFIFA